MKRFVPAPRLPFTTGRIARHGCFAVLVLFSGTFTCYGIEPSSGNLDVAVEDISYQGNDAYKVSVFIRNRSDKGIVLKENKEDFAVQTEILGRWQELSASDLSPTKSALIPPRREIRAVYRIRMPLTMRSLYRNSEGDVNMKHRYRIGFTTGSEAVLRTEDGESSYWITPKTNKWILREGM